MKIKYVTISMDDDWWKKLSSADKAKYIKEHPNSKFAQSNKNTGESDKTKHPNFIAHVGTATDAIRKDWKARPVEIDEVDIIHKLGLFLAKEKMSEGEMLELDTPIRKCLISSIILVKNTLGGIPRTAQSILTKKFIEHHLLDGGLSTEESKAEVSLDDMIKELLKQTLLFVEPNIDMIQAEVKKARLEYGCPKCGADSSLMFRCRDSDLKCDNGHIWHSLDGKKILGERKK